MKKAIIGTGLLICGTIGLSAQMLREAIFTANQWQTVSGGLLPPQLPSGAVLAAGAALCIRSLWERGGGDGEDAP